MKSNIDERKYDSYRDAPNGKSKVAVTLEGDAGLLQGITYDDIQAEFTSSTITNYKYYSSSVLVATIEVTFTDSAHSDVLRARRI
jgi:hypothetical protein